MNHTPGPWEVGPGDVCRVNVSTGSLLHPDEPRIATKEDIEELGDDCHDDWGICQCDDDERPYDECVANALLIAVAPDLLAKLDAVQCYCPIHVQDEIRNLIAKATGQPE